jgi:hypothetical protein
VQRTLLVFLMIVAVAGLAAGAWWVTRAKAPISVDPVGPTAGSGVSARTTETAEPRVELGAPEIPSDSPESFTTVVFPLEVELELVHTNESPQAAGVPARGSGAKAQIKGTIRDTRNAGVRAEIEFVAGSNQGRILYCDGSGEFGARDLNPGISIVRVSGPGIAGSEREVMLRQDRETLFNLSYARPQRVAGTVYDRESKPIAGASVSFDGQKTTTDENGVFELGAVALGDALVVIQKPGYAGVRQKSQVSIGAAVDASKLKFLLEPGAHLTVSVVETINTSEEAWLYILPIGAGQERKFPWHTKNPVRVWPGGSVTIDDLPPGMVSLRLFHAGAVAKPASSSVLLGPGDTTSVDLHLEPAPVVQGVVMDGKSPAPAAKVVLEAPDRTAAMLALFGESNYLFLENDVFPSLPPAVQSVTTNGLGEFVLNANEWAAPVRYLSATSQDGKRVAHAVLKPGDKTATLALAPVESGSGALRLVTQTRYQPLPVKVIVDGTPRDPMLLPKGRDLSIGSLPRGSWLVTVRWNGEKLIFRAPIQLEGEVSMDVALPQGAIDGQDDDTRKRVGPR